MTFIQKQIANLNEAQAQIQACKVRMEKMQADFKQLEEEVQKLKAAQSELQSAFSQEERNFTLYNQVAHDYSQVIKDFEADEAAEAVDAGVIEVIDESEAPVEATPEVIEALTESGKKAVRKSI